MKSNLKYVGGIWITKQFLGSAWKLSITSPFVELDIDQEDLIISLFRKKKYFLIKLFIYWFAILLKLNAQYILPIKEIDSIKHIRYFPLIAEGIQINHHANAPKYIIFWTTSTKELLQMLKEKRIRIESK